MPASRTNQLLAREGFRQLNTQFGMLLPIVSLEIFGASNSAPAQSLRV